MDFRKRFLSGLLAVCFAFALAACGVSGVNHDLEDGTYLVEILLEGGSGRSHIQSPAELTVQDGTMSVTLVWSSTNYDYMVVDGKTFFPVSLTPGSTFCIPVEKLGERFSVSADTTAMSTPHEIEYTLTVFAPGESAGEVEPTESTAASAPATEGAVSQMLIYDHSMELHAAQGFSVDYYKDGYALLTIKQDSSRFLLIPQEKETPADLAEDVTPLRLPLQNVYLAASAVMDMFISLDALDTLAFSGTKEEGWYLPEAREAMAQGRIRYLRRHCPGREKRKNRGVFLHQLQRRRKCAPHQRLYSGNDRDGRRRLPPPGYGRGRRIRLRNLLHADGILLRGSERRGFPDL